MMGIGMSFAGAGLVWMLLFWGALLFGGFWLARGLAGAATTHGRTPRAPQRPVSAQEILAQRYARGEISREEFEQARRDLSA